MKILFAFENILPSSEADAEVFTATAKSLAPLTARSWLHVPMLGRGRDSKAGLTPGPTAVRAFAPARPAALRHFCCGLTLVFRKEFHEADLVYTRNLWIAWLAVLRGKRVAFDHYRPWHDQIPPLQPWIRALISNRLFLVNICHSDYTKSRYLELGVPESKLRCIRNGFDPGRLRPALPIEVAKRRIGVSPDRKTVVYTGRINHKKGLGLLIEAAKRLPDLLFILVGSTGDGPIEALSSRLANILVVPWQQSGTLADHIYAADVLLIPPSWQPLAKFGSTVLPLKLFFYMASGRPILAGETTDIRELLKHGRNAFLCQPDCVDALVSGLRTLTGDAELAARLAAAAQSDSRDLTWDARAHRIADLLAIRLESAPSACVAWSGGQTLAWLHQSWRWLMHLIRQRSWILPADIGASVVTIPSPGRD